ASSAKFPKFILPVVFDLLSDRRSVRIAALVVASWYQYLKLNLATPHNVQDEMAAALLQSVAQAERRQDPLLFLEHAEVFGNIKEYRAFTESFLSHIVALSNIGMKRLIEEIN